MNLTGKWRYFENYGNGVAEGELYLKQEGKELSGRFVFSYSLSGEVPYMIVDFLTGILEEKKVKLEATGFDVIHADFPVSYELDYWFGLLVDETTIRGVSRDEQGIEGYFVFEKLQDDVSLKFVNEIPDRSKR